MVSRFFFIGRFARSAERLFGLIWGDFEVFRPTGMACCTDGSGIWRGVVDRRYSMPNFTASVH